MITPPDPATFFPRVWRIVQQVPYATVSTYGQIASMIPAPAGIEAEHFARLGAKWVGDALNAVSFDELDGKPVPANIPWWRIINSQGGISMPEGSPAAREQLRRLEAEGVTFDARTRTALSVYGWNGPTDAWLQSEGLLKPKPLRKPDEPRQMSLF